jgi:hypothetical protein
MDSGNIQSIIRNRIVECEVCVTGGTKRLFTQMYGP